MPFTKIDVSEEIEKRKVESETFAKAWEDSREEYELIGNMISLRKEQNITQKELADMIGKKQQVISRIEKKENSPSLSLFCKIISALGYKIKIEKR